MKAQQLRQRMGKADPGNKPGKMILSLEAVFSNRLYHQEKHPAAIVKNRLENLLNPHIVHTFFDTVEIGHIRIVGNRTRCSRAAAQGLLPGIIVLT